MSSNQIFSLKVLVKSYPYLVLVRVNTIPAIILNSLCLGYDGIVKMTGGAEKVVGYPVLIIRFHLSVQHIVYEFWEGGGLAVPAYFYFGRH